MKTYGITVARITSDAKKFIVEADSEDAARTKAVQDACDHDWGGGAEAIYDVEAMEEIT